MRRCWRSGSAKLPAKVEYIRARLAELAGHPRVGDIRQCGMMIGIELVADRKSGDSPHFRKTENGDSPRFSGLHDETFLRALGIARRMGCLFHFASDAHELADAQGVAAAAFAVGAALVQATIAVFASLLFPFFRGLPVYVLRANTVSQLETVLSDLFDLGAVPFDEAEDVALAEAQEAIKTVLSGAASVDLNPATPKVRRMQHDLARQANLVSHSYGKEPYRRVKIFRD